MPARTGQDYIRGLQERLSEVWIGGERQVSGVAGSGGAVRADAGSRRLQTLVRHHVVKPTHSFDRSYLSQTSCVDPETDPLI
jgi:hypothetical protein